MSWAEPDLAHAIELMRRVFKEREAAAREAGARAERLRATFSLERIGALAHQRLLHLLRRTNPAKWQRLQSAERRAHLRPAIPIPGDWYDADYFEHGLKSNWRDGYHWSAFSGLFRETGALLTDIFAEAESFLDAGCAKGFLVRALRERGKLCRGFDHSAWALEHAEPLARPHLRLAGVENVVFEESHDVLLAFDLFESLTEAQARSFLERVRPHTRQALVAVMATFEDQARPAASSGGDLSQITLRPRGWWHDLLLACGWKQDALHRILQRQCQAHPLARRMEWPLFIYAPG